MNMHETYARYQYHLSQGNRIRAALYKLCLHLNH